MKCASTKQRLIGYARVTGNVRLVTRWERADPNIRQ